jgi:phenylacetate-CoA ligase
MSAATASYYDVLETRSPAEREASLMAALPGVLAHAKAHAPAYATVLGDLTPSEVNNRAALAKLPVTRKSELIERQKTARVQGDAFGGFATIGWRPRRGAQRVFASPGPIYEPEGEGPDY